MTNDQPPDLTLIHPERLLHLLGPVPTVHTSPVAAIWKAVMLAPRIETCEALLRRQPVPTSALDPVWVKRFGLDRKKAA
jgi:hypothetical protein